MVSSRAFRLAAFAIGAAGVVLLGNLLTSPAFGQRDVFNVITKLIEQQRELVERRRQEASAIKRMQFGLKTLGYYDGLIDGDFGPRTAAALGTYRRSAGRPDSGMLSIEEITEIESEASRPQPEQPTTPAEPSPEAPTSDAFIRAVTPPRLNAKLPDAAAWIIIASRTNPEEAKQVAEQYLHWFPSTAVIHSSNGVFAISIGWLNKERGRPLKDALISKNLIPADSFLSSGDKLEPPIWSADGHKIHSRTDLLLYALLRTTSEAMGELPNTGSGGFNSFNSRVGGLADSTSDYLSLRTGSSTSSKELRRLPEATQLKILRTDGEWHRVELLNGMTGWVSAKYVSPDATGGEAEPKPEAVSPEKRERDRQVVEAATILLDDLVVYLKLNRETPDIASIAEEVSKLQQAVRDEDIPSIEATTIKLKSAMEAISGFPEFIGDREKERTRIEVQKRGQATTLASKHQWFLRKQIADNITSSSAPALARFLTEYESAMKSPELSTLTELNDRLKKFVSENALQQAYDDAVLNSTQPTPALEPTPAPAPKSPIVKTEKNRHVLEGDLTDWVLVWNASGKAPHVARNLRGDIVFEDQQADACVLHPPAEKLDAVLLAVEDILKKYKVDKVRLDPSACPETNLQSFDVLIANRGEFLKQPQSYVVPLLGLIENDAFKELKTLTSEEFTKSEKARGVESTEIEDAILNGSREGYGLIKIDNDSAVICMTTDEQEAAHRALINDQRDLLLRSFNATPDIQLTSLEAAFIAAERGQCGAIYGNRPSLADAIRGLWRDKIPVSVVPMWFEPKVVETRANQIQSEKERLAKKQQDLEQKKKDEEELRKRRDALREEQEKKIAQQKEAREAKLQEQHGAQAKGRAEEIAAVIKALAEEDEEEATQAIALFPDLARMYRDHIIDGWEYVALDSEITDYGTADWKGRQLEMVFTDVAITMKNRILGEYKKLCFSAALIFDEEFKMRRDPLEEFNPNCEQASDLPRAWKQARGFQSQWLAE